MEQKGVTVWFTGHVGRGQDRPGHAPGSRNCASAGLKVERLDGDIVRQSLTRDLGFSKEDRDKNIERVTFVAKLLTRNGVAVLCSFISPYRAVRAKVREAGRQLCRGLLLRAAGDPHRAGCQGPVQKGPGRRDQELYRHL